MGLSLEERERRYGLIRQEMARQDLDVLVVIGRDGSNNRGNHRYIAGYGVMAPYDHYAVFPREPLEPIFFAGGSISARNPMARGWANEWRPPRKMRGPIREEVRRFRNSGGIGLVQMDTVPTGIYLDMVEDYGADGVRDATDIFRRARWIKSAEEIECCRKSAQVADEAYLLLKSIARPGVTDGEVYGQVRRLIHERGCEYSMEMIGFGDGAASDFAYAPIGRVLTEKGWVSLEITPAYQGYFTQLYVDMPIAGYSPEQRQMVDAWARGQQAAIQALRPGARACDIYRAAEAALKRVGCDIGEAAGHSLGLDVHEVLSLQADDETVLEAGMIIVVHVAALRPLTRAKHMSGTTFLVTKDGSEPLNKARLM